MACGSRRQRAVDAANGILRFIGHASRDRPTVGNKSGASQDSKHRRGFRAPDSCRNENADACACGRRMRREEENGLAVMAERFGQSTAGLPCVQRSQAIDIVGAQQCQAVAPPFDQGWIFGSAQANHARPTQRGTARVGDVAREQRRQGERVRRHRGCEIVRGIDPIERNARQRPQPFGMRRSCEGRQLVARRMRCRIGRRRDQGQETVETQLARGNRMLSQRAGFTIQPNSIGAAKSCRVVADRAKFSVQGIRRPIGRHASNQTG